MKGTLLSFTPLLQCLGRTQMILYNGFIPPQLYRNYIRYSDTPIRRGFIGQPIQTRWQIQGFQHWSVAVSIWLLCSIWAVTWQWRFHDQRGILYAILKMDIRTRGKVSAKIGVERFFQVKDSERGNSACQIPNIFKWAFQLQRFLESRNHNMNH